MAKPQPGVWGIDLGQCALKALRVEQQEGKLIATTFDYVEYPKILTQPDADPDQLIREALEQFLSRNNLRGDQVAISVPGQSGLARFVKLPPVEEKKIADIVRFEAKQQIPFNLDEVVWDYQKLGAGQVVDGFALETEIGLFAMKRDVIKRYLDHFKEVNVEVHFIQMAPLALCNFVSYDLLDPAAQPSEGGVEAGNCVVVLDIGTDSSNLVVTDGGRVIWQRPIPLGGNHFTRVLTKELKLTFAKAEHLKRNAAKSPPEFKKMLQALKPVFNDFVGEVQRSLGFFNNTHRDANIAYMLGLGNAFRLPVLQKFLQEKLGLEVRKLGKMQRLEGEALGGAIYIDNVLSFGVAYGLALQGLNLSKVTTNLLPGELRTERMIRAKKPWAVAAAGLLLAGLGLILIDDYLVARPYKNEPVANAVKKSGDVAKTAKELDSAFTNAKSNAIKEEEAVKAIVAGQEERENWIKMLRFLTDCLPQPDGKNLPQDKETLAAYWDRPAKPALTSTDPIGGQAAYDLFLQRQRAGNIAPPMNGGAETIVEAAPAGLRDLIQFNIEHVDSRYCDDLKSYWQSVKPPEYAKGAVRPISNYDIMPEGKGWVVEVQGFTYHRAGENFIRNTLVANIGRLGCLKAPVFTPGTPMPGATGAGATPRPGPAATVPPAGAPASGTPAPTTPGGAPAATGKTPETKSEEEKVVKEDPVIDRVSHVLLYETKQRPAVDGAAFEIIKDSVLDSLIHAPAPLAAAGGAPPAAGAAPPAAGGVPGGAAAVATPESIRESWQSQSGRGGSGAGPVTGPGALPGMNGPTRRVGRNPMPGVPVPTPAPGAHPNGAVAIPANKQLMRTEFTILFIWREPTNSDKLRESSATPGTPAVPSPGPGPGAIRK
jgi:type IV pilus assembly protein PilM